jgi:hypothetical protein
MASAVREVKGFFKAKNTGPPGFARCLVAFT